MRRKNANLRLKTHVKSLAKQLVVALHEGKTDEAAEINKKLQQSAAKSAKSNVFHKNKVGRLTSKASKSINISK